MNTYIRIKGKIFKVGDSFGVRIRKALIDSNIFHEGEEVEMALLSPEMSKMMEKLENLSIKEKFWVQQAMLNKIDELRSGDSSDEEGGLLNGVYCPIDLMDFSDWGYSDWTVIQPWVESNVFR
jgi:hypothetical protein